MTAPVDASLPKYEDFRLTGDMSDALASCTVRLQKCAEQVQGVRSWEIRTRAAQAAPKP